MGSLAGVYEASKRQNLDSCIELNTICKCRRADFVLSAGVAKVSRTRFLVNKIYGGELWSSNLFDYKL